MPDASSEHVRRPKQERSRKTLRRIREAALELFAERGVEATTVADIVERADSSIGSFYARFDGKEALVRYLEQRVWGRARERWDEALKTRTGEELSLDGLVRGLVTSLARLHESDAAQRRALESHARQRGSRDPEEEAFHRHVEEDVRALLLERRDRIGHPDPETAAAVAYRWLLGGIRELLDGSDLPGGREMTVDEVVEELSRGLLAYLGAGPGPDAPAKEVEFFDVWQ